MKTEKVQQFWKDFCEACEVEESTPYQVWYFGDSPEMATELANLVISGQKRATGSNVEFNKKYPDAAPVDGGISIVTDFEDNPMCVIQTIEIRHVPFLEVDAAFAFDEGEGDRTLEYWRSVNTDYFIREAAEFGLESNDQIMVCCERFRLLYPVE